MPKNTLDDLGRRAPWDLRPYNERRGKMISQNSISATMQGEWVDFLAQKNILIPKS
jgi:hypothetical protein